MLLRMLFTIIMAMILMLTLNRVFNPYVVIILAFIITFVVFYLPLVYTAYFTKNMKKVDQLLIKNKHQPIYQLYYGLAHRKDEEIDKAMSLIKKKYQRPDQRALFETIVALHRKDLHGIETLIEKIRPELYKKYYEVAYLIELDKLEEAEVSIKQIKRGWMKEAALTELELKKGNQSTAYEHFQKALAGTGGLQRYSIYYSYYDKFNSN